jgi:hypothetical protein
MSHPLPIVLLAADRPADSKRPGGPLQRDEVTLWCPEHTPPLGVLRAPLVRARVQSKRRPTITRRCRVDSHSFVTLGLAAVERYYDDFDARGRFPLG